MRPSELENARHTPQSSVNTSLFQRSTPFPFQPSSLKLSIYPQSSNSCNLVAILGGNANDVSRYGPNSASTALTPSFNAVQFHPQQQSAKDDLLPPHKDNKERKERGRKLTSFDRGNLLSDLARHVLVGSGREERLREVLKRKEVQHERLEDFWDVALGDSVGVFRQRGAEEVRQGCRKKRLVGREGCERG